MNPTAKGRKEPTVVFSIRLPVSLEAETVELADRHGVQRNAFIAEAVREKVARERKRSARAAASAA